MNEPEGQRIISLSGEVQLNKSDNAWKPSSKPPGNNSRQEEVEEYDPDEAKAQDLFNRVRGVLNKLTPQRFSSLMGQVTQLLQRTIDTEERLTGVIDLIFEKAISESKYSELYAEMCLCHSKFKVPTTDKPGDSVTFQHLLLNRCQKEFEKDKDDEEIFEKKQKELDAAPGEEKQRLKEELEESKDNAKRRSLGNVKFIGELFKRKMLTEGIVHDCIIKLLNNRDEMSLECLCRLFETTGEGLDSEKAKGRMDKYFKEMEDIRKGSKAMIRCKLQDVLDLRGNNWVPRREIQGPKTIDGIREDAKMEEHREKMKAEQAFIANKGLLEGSGGRASSHARNRLNVPQDKSWNPSVPISTKNAPIDNLRLIRIIKAPVPDMNNLRLGPGGESVSAVTSCWAKGCNGWTSVSGSVG